MDFPLTRASRWIRTTARDLLLRLLVLVDGPRWSPVVRVRLQGSPKWTTHRAIRRVDYRPCPGTDYAHAVLVDSYGNETLYRLDEVVALKHIREEPQPRHLIEPVPVVMW